MQTHRSEEANYQLNYKAHSSTRKQHSSVKPPTIPHHNIPRSNKSGSFNEINVFDNKGHSIEKYKMDHSLQSVANKKTSENSSSRKSSPGQDECSSSSESKHSSAKHAHLHKANYIPASRTKSSASERSSSRGSNTNSSSSSTYSDTTTKSSKSSSDGDKSVYKLPNLGKRARHNSQIPDLGQDLVLPDLGSDLSETSSSDDDGVYGDCVVSHVSDNITTYVNTCANWSDDEHDGNDSHSSSNMGDIKPAPYDDAYTSNVVDSESGGYYVTRNNPDYSGSDTSSNRGRNKGFSGVGQATVETECLICGENVDTMESKHMCSQKFEQQDMSNSSRNEHDTIYEFRMNENEHVIPGYPNLLNENPVLLNIKSEHGPSNSALIQHQYDFNLALLSQGHPPGNSSNLVNVSGSKMDSLNETLNENSYAALIEGGLDQPQDSDEIKSATICDIQDLTVLASVQNKSVPERSSILGNKLSDCVRDAFSDNVMCSSILSSRVSQDSDKTHPTICEESVSSVETHPKSSSSFKCVSSEKTHHVSTSDHACLSSRSSCSSSSSSKTRSKSTFQDHSVGSNKTCAISMLAAYCEGLDNSDESNCGSSHLLHLDSKDEQSLSQEHCQDYNEENMPSIQRSPSESLVPHDSVSSLTVLKQPHKEIYLRSNNKESGTIGCSENSLKNDGPLQQNYKMCNIPNKENKVSSNEESVKQTDTSRVLANKSNDSRTEDTHFSEEDPDLEDGEIRSPDPYKTACDSDTEKSSALVSKSLEFEEKRSHFSFSEIEFKVQPLIPTTSIIEHDSSETSSFPKLKLTKTFPQLTWNDNRNNYQKTHELDSKYEGKDGMILEQLQDEIWSKERKKRSQRSSKDEADSDLHGGHTEGEMKDTIQGQGCKVITPEDYVERMDDKSKGSRDLVLQGRPTELAKGLDGNKQAKPDFSSYFKSVEGMFESPEKSNSKANYRNKAIRGRKVHSAVAVYKKHSQLSNSSDEEQLGRDNVKCEQNISSLEIIQLQRVNSQNLDNESVKPKAYSEESIPVKSSSVLDCCKCDLTFPSQLELRFHMLRQHVSPSRNKLQRPMQYERQRSDSTHRSNDKNRKSRKRSGSRGVSNSPIREKSKSSSGSRLDHRYPGCSDAPSSSKVWRRSSSPCDSGKSERKYKCSYCRNCFSDRVRREVHEEERHKSKRVRSEKMTASTLVQLTQSASAQVESVSENPNRGSLEKKCKLCYSGFRMTSHSAFVCAKCKQCYGSYNSYAAHSEHCKQESSHICVECAHSFSDESALSSHICTTGVKTKKQNTNVNCVKSSPRNTKQHPDCVRNSPKYSSPRSARNTSISPRRGTTTSAASISSRTGATRPTSMSPRRGATTIVNVKTTSKTDSAKNSRNVDDHFCVECGRGFVSTEFLENHICNAGKETVKDVTSASQTIQLERSGTKIKSSQSDTLQTQPPSDVKSVEIKDTKVHSSLFRNSEEDSMLKTVESVADIPMPRDKPVSIKEVCKIVPKREKTKIVKNIAYSPNLNEEIKSSQKESMKEHRSFKDSYSKEKVMLASSLPLQDQYPLQEKKETIHNVMSNMNRNPDVSSNSVFSKVSKDILRSKPAALPPVILKTHKEITEALNERSLKMAKKFPKTGLNHSCIADIVCPEIKPVTNLPETSSKLDTRQKKSLSLSEYTSKYAKNRKSGNESSSSSETSHSESGENHSSFQVKGIICSGFDKNSSQDIENKISDLKSDKTIDPTIIVNTANTKNKESFSSRKVDNQQKDRSNALKPIGNVRQQKLSTETDKGSDKSTKGNSNIGWKDLKINPKIAITENNETFLPTEKETDQIKHREILREPINVQDSKAVAVHSIPSQSTDSCKDSNLIVPGFVNAVPASQLASGCEFEIVPVHPCPFCHIELQSEVDLQQHIQNKHPESEENQVEMENETSQPCFDSGVDTSDENETTQAEEQSEQGEITEKRRSLTREECLEFSNEMKSQGHKSDKGEQHSECQDHELNNLQGQLSSEIPRHNSNKPGENENQGMNETRRHLSSEGEGQGSYEGHVCEFCDKKFVGSEHLDKHVRKRHSEKLSLSDRRAKLVRLIQQIDSQMEHTLAYSDSQIAESDSQIGQSDSVITKSDSNMCQSDMIKDIGLSSSAELSEMEQQISKTEEEQNKSVKETLDNNLCQETIDKENSPSYEFQMNSSKDDMQSNTAMHVLPLGLGDLEYVLLDEFHASNLAIGGKSVENEAFEVPVTSDQVVYQQFVQEYPACTSSITTLGLDEPLLSMNTQEMVQCLNEAEGMVQSGNVTGEIVQGMNTIQEVGNVNLIQEVVPAASALCLNNTAEIVPVDVDLSHTEEIITSDSNSDSDGVVYEYNLQDTCLHGDNPQEAVLIPLNLVENVTSDPLLTVVAGSDLCYNQAAVLGNAELVTSDGSLIVDDHEHHSSSSGSSGNSSPLAIVEQIPLDSFTMQEIVNNSVSIGGCESASIGEQMASFGSFEENIVNEVNDKNAIDLVHSLAGQMVDDVNSCHGSNDGESNHGNPDELDTLPRTERSLSDETREVDSLIEQCFTGTGVHMTGSSPASFTGNSSAGFIGTDLAQHTRELLAGNQIPRTLGGTNNLNDSFMKYGNGISDLYVQETKPFSSDEEDEDEDGVHLELESTTEMYKQCNLTKFKPDLDVNDTADIDLNCSNTLFDSSFESSQEKEKNRSVNQSQGEATDNERIKGAENFYGVLKSRFSSPEHKMELEMCKKKHSGAHRGIKGDQHRSLVDTVKKTEAMKHSSKQKHISSDDKSKPSVRESIKKDSKHNKDPLKIGTSKLNASEIKDMVRKLQEKHFSKDKHGSSSVKTTHCEGSKDTDTKDKHVDDKKKHDYTSRDKTSNKYKDKHNPVHLKKSDKIDSKIKSKEDSAKHGSKMLERDWKSGIDKVDLPSTKSTKESVRKSGIDKVDLSLTKSTKESDRKSKIDKVDLPSTKSTKESVRKSGIDKVDLSSTKSTKESDRKSKIDKVDLPSTKSSKESVRKSGIDKVDLSSTKSTKESDRKCGIEKVDLPSIKSTKESDRKSKIDKVDLSSTKSTKERDRKSKIDKVDLPSTKSTKVTSDFKKESVKDKSDKHSKGSTSSSSSHRSSHSSLKDFKTTDPGIDNKAYKMLSQGDNDRNQMEMNESHGSRGNKEAEIKSCQMITKSERKEIERTKSIVESKSKTVRPHEKNNDREGTEETARSSSDYKSKTSSNSPSSRSSHRHSDKDKTKDKTTLDKHNLSQKSHDSIPRVESEKVPSSSKHSKERQKSHKPNHKNEEKHKSERTNKEEQHKNAKQNVESLKHDETQKEKSVSNEQVKERRKRKHSSDTEQSDSVLKHTSSDSDSDRSKSDPNRSKTKNSPAHSGANCSNVESVCSETDRLNTKRSPVYSDSIRSRAKNSPVHSTHSHLKPVLDDNYEKHLQSKETSKDNIKAKDFRKRKLDANKTEIIDTEKSDKKLKLSQDQSKNSPLSVNVQQHMSPEPQIIDTEKSNKKMKLSQDQSQNSPSLNVQQHMSPEPQSSRVENETQGESVSAHPVYPQCIASEKKRKCMTLIRPSKSQGRRHKQGASKSKKRTLARVIRRQQERNHNNNNRMCRFLRGSVSSNSSSEDFTKAECRVRCGVCRAWVASRSKLALHRSIYHSVPNKGNIHLCNRCGRGFGHERVLEYHKALQSLCIRQTISAHAQNGLVNDETQNHIPQKKLAYTCATCEKKFATRSQCSQHASVHYDTRPYSCLECDRTYRTKRALQHHGLIHMSRCEYVCERCEEAFTHRRTLKLHVQHCNRPISASNPVMSSPDVIEQPSLGIIISDSDLTGSRTWQEDKNHSNDYITDSRMWPGDRNHCDDSTTWHEDRNLSNDNITDSRTWHEDRNHSNDYITDSRSLQEDRNHSDDSMPILTPVYDLHHNVNTSIEHGSSTSEIQGDIYFEAQNSKLEYSKSITNITEGKETPDHYSSECSNYGQKLNKNNNSRIMVTDSEFSVDTDSSFGYTEYLGKHNVNCQKNIYDSFSPNLNHGNSSLEIGNAVIINGTPVKLRKLSITLTRCDEQISKSVYCPESKLNGQKQKSKYESRTRTRKRKSSKSKSELEQSDYKFSDSKLKQSQSDYIENSQHDLNMSTSENSQFDSSDGFRASSEQTGFTSPHQLRDCEKNIFRDDSFYKYESVFTSRQFGPPCTEKLSNSSNSNSMPTLQPNYDYPGEYSQLCFQQEGFGFESPTKQCRKRTESNNSSYSNSGLYFESLNRENGVLSESDMSPNDKNLSDENEDQSDNGDSSEDENESDEFGDNSALLDNLIQSNVNLGQSESEADENEVKSDYGDSSEEGNVSEEIGDNSVLMDTPIQSNINSGQTECEADINEDQSDYGDSSSDGNESDESVDHSALLDNQVQSNVHSGQTECEPENEDQPCKNGNQADDNGKHSDDNADQSSESESESDSEPEDSEISARNKWIAHVYSSGSDSDSSSEDEVVGLLEEPDQNSDSYGNAYKNPETGSYVERNYDELISNRNARENGNQPWTKWRRMSSNDSCEKETGSNHNYMNTDYENGMMDNVENSIMGSVREEEEVMSHLTHGTLTDSDDDSSVTNDNTYGTEYEQNKKTYDDDTYEHTYDNDFTYKNGSQHGYKRNTYNNTNDSHYKQRQQKNLHKETNNNKKQWKEKI